MTLYYHFMCDIQALLVAKNEDKIETSDQLFHREDITIFINGQSNNYRILQKVIKLTLNSIASIRIKLCFLIVEGLRISGI